MDLVLRSPLFFDPFSHLIPVPGAAVCSKQAVPAKPLSPGGQTLAERDVLGALTGPLARRSVQFGGGGIFWCRRLCGKAVEQEGVSGAARREGAVRFYLPQSKGVRAGWFSFLGTEKKKEERSARTRSRVIYSPSVSNG